MICDRMGFQNAKDRGNRADCIGNIIGPVGKGDKRGAEDLQEDEDFFDAKILLIRVMEGGFFLDLFAESLDVAEDGRDLPRVFFALVGNMNALHVIERFFKAYCGDGMGGADRRREMSHRSSSNHPVANQRSSDTDAR